MTDASNPWPPFRKPDEDHISFGPDHSPRQRPESGPFQPRSADDWREWVDRLPDAQLRALHRMLLIPEHVSACQFRDYFWTTLGWQLFVRLFYSHGGPLIAHTHDVLRFWDSEYAVAYANVSLYWSVCAEFEDRSAENNIDDCDESDEFGEESPRDREVEHEHDAECDEADEVDGFMRDYHSDTYEDLKDDEGVDEDGEDPDCTADTAELIDESEAEEAADKMYNSDQSGWRCADPILPRGWRFTPGSRLRSATQLPASDVERADSDGTVKRELSERDAQISDDQIPF